MSKWMYYGLNEEPQVTEIITGNTDFQQESNESFIPLGNQLVVIAYDNNDKYQPNRYISNVNREIIGVIHGDFIVGKICENETIDLKAEDIESIYKCCGYPEEESSCLD